ncbi:hypothetical protein BPAE_0375g00010 [Botrytis paeoniae]|uniref:Fucose-specific lectin n=1 Tax=Botrytis paeoniae TaxID=278948 RepID=A0A4Z1F4J2_9HELO|nr:hypothetical protein BPAE_0375g00010 [Botrytis paeoniae]
MRATSIAPVFAQLGHTNNEMWQSRLSAGEWQDSQSSVYTVTEDSGICYSASSSYRSFPPTYRTFVTKPAFASKLSHISTAQPTNNGLSSVVHYITRKSHTEFDIWAISDATTLFHRSYTGTMDVGAWTEWEDLGKYNSLAKPAVAYDAANNTYIMTLGSNNNNKYNFKLYNSQTGWSPGKTTWILTIYTHWLTQPTISVYDNGATRASDVHVWGINKNGKLYYSHLRNGQWWPRSNYYYEVMDVPGIVPSINGESYLGAQQVLAQDELK